MDDTGGGGIGGVYNSTTVSYDNHDRVSIPTGGGGDEERMANGQRRPWNLSEMVSPPVVRSRWFHWVLLMGGSIVLGLGLIVVVIGIYNQHYYDPKSHIVRVDEDEKPPSHWIVTLVGVGFSIFGIILLVLYCRIVNTNNLLCNPLSQTRSALRQVVTKPRYPSGRENSRGSSLLSSDRMNGMNPILTQYNPIPDIAFRGQNEVTSEEKANLMANEVKEGIDDIPSSCDALLCSDSSNRTTPSTNSSSKDPRIVFLNGQPCPPPRAGRNTEVDLDEEDDDDDDASAKRFAAMFINKHSPFPPKRPPRHKFCSLRRDLDPYPASSSSHYKARHFAGHGYGQGVIPSSLSSSINRKAPLASIEDITPSLRSSFASVMMYPPSDWGNSVENSDDDASFDSTIMSNFQNHSEPTNDEEGDADEEDNDDTRKVMPVPESKYDFKFEDFRISPARKVRKSSLSALSVQSAFP